MLIIIKIRWTGHTSFAYVTRGNIKMANNVRGEVNEVREERLRRRRECYESGVCNLLGYCKTKAGYFISGIWPRALACTWHLAICQKLNQTIIAVLTLSLYSTHTVTYKNTYNHDQARPHDTFSICLVQYTYYIYIIMVC